MYVFILDLKGYEDLYLKVVLGMVFLFYKYFIYVFNVFDNLNIKII